MYISPQESIAYVHVDGVGNVGVETRQGFHHLLDEEWDDEGQVALVVVVGAPGEQTCIECH